MSAIAMQLDRPDAYETSTELDLMERLLPLAEARVLELGCGGAWTIRQMAERYPTTQFIGTEVDQVQHAKNLRLDLPNVEFRLKGAQQISEPDDSVDIIWMLKSLHHVPSGLMQSAMQEISRVLKPGGLAWFCEPVYAGPFNLESAVGRGGECSCSLAGQGTTTRNSYSIPRSCNTAMQGYKSAIRPVA